MTRRRTYSHLSQLGRKPSDYDIATSNLLYYLPRGFEIQSPLSDWYAKYQVGSRFQCKDWEAFRDPSETTYAKYTERQKNKEVFVEGLLRAADGEYDARLTSHWITVLDRVFAPMMFPVHGLQMVASYVGSMAPSGRIVVACALQAADEIRRIQRIAYRVRQLQSVHAGFGERAKSIWLTDVMWQPLRKVVERLLVTYDWGEAFVALNLVVKPIFDDFVTKQLGEAAMSFKDDVLSRMLFSLGEDCAWHRAWSTSLVSTVTKSAPEVESVVAEWMDQWRPSAQAAVYAFAPIVSSVVANGGSAELQSDVGPSSTSSGIYDSRGSRVS